MSKFISKLWLDSIVDNSLQGVVVLGNYYRLLCLM